MRTSTARANGYRCPVCQDETTRDEAGMGYVRHLRNRDCAFEKGERDSGPVADDGWVAVEVSNRSPSVLLTRAVKLYVGEPVEIWEERSRRRVSSVTGSPGDWMATFDFPLPVGIIHWRVAKSTSDRASAAPSPGTPPRAEAMKAVKPGDPAGPGPSSKVTVVRVLEITAVIVTIIGGLVTLLTQLK